METKFMDFNLQEILKNVTPEKKIAIRGKFRNKKENTLVVLERKLEESKFSGDLSSLKEKFVSNPINAKKVLDNDCLEKYHLSLDDESDFTTMTVRNPASRKHIEQFKEPKFFLIEETPELYKEVTLREFKNKPKKYKKWIDNILEEKAEVDRVIFNDKDKKTGFVLVKDSDWLDDDIQKLNFLAIARQDLMSIRELDKTHLPLLKNIKEAGSKAIKEKYGISAENLRICFHYLPSSYHLHVHFAHFTADNTERVVDRIHLLARVINNIELMSDYYQKATLTIRHCKYESYKPYEDYLEKKKATDKKINTDKDDRPPKRKKLSE